MKPSIAGLFMALSLAVLVAVAEIIMSPIVRLSEIVPYGGSVLNAAFMALAAGTAFVFLGTLSGLRGRAFQGLPWAGLVSLVCLAGAVWKLETVTQLVTGPAEMTVLSILLVTGGILSIIGSKESLQQYSLHY